MCAAISMLANTDDPLRLVPGSPAQVWMTVRLLADCAKKFDDISNRLKRIGDVEWEDKTGDAFREKYAIHPTRWALLSDLFGDVAAAALDSYAHTLDWAQREAREAVAQWKEGIRRTEEAAKTNPLLQSAYTQAKQMHELGLPHLNTVAVSDPGLELRTSAHERLERARVQLNKAGNEAARKMKKALDAAPIHPSFLKDFSIAAVEYGHYLVGRGAPRYGNVRDYSWPRMRVSDFVDVNGYIGKEGGNPIVDASTKKSSYTPTDFQGQAVVGQLSFKLSGTLKVNGNEWELIGTADPADDFYNFDVFQDRSDAGRAATAVGFLVGEYARWGSSFLLQPTDYYRKMSGEIPIHETGRFHNK